MLGYPFLLEEGTVTSADDGRYNTDRNNWNQLCYLTWALRIILELCMDSDHIINVQV